MKKEKIAIYPPGRKVLVEAKASRASDEHKIDFWAIASLFKLRIVALLLFTAGTSAYLSSNGQPPAKALILLIIAGGLSSMGSAALNHFVDQRVDAVMSRTNKRPLPQGKISPQSVLAIGLALLAVSLLLAWQINLLTAVLVGAGALVYVVLYTSWLKCTSRLNIIVGGLSGSFASLAGWSAVNGKDWAPALAMALLLFLWTPSHFWSFSLLHRKDYLRSGIPMLSAVLPPKEASGVIAINTLLLIAFSIAIYFFTFLGPLYLAGALMAGAVFFGHSVLLWTKPSPYLALRNFKLSGFYLIALLSVIIADVYVAI